MSALTAVEVRSQETVGKEIACLLDHIQPLVADGVHRMLGISIPSAYANNIDCNICDSISSSSSSNVVYDVNKAGVKEGFSSFLRLLSSEQGCLLLSRDEARLERKIEAFQLAARSERAGMGDFGDSCSDNSSSGSSSRSSSRNGLLVVTDFDYTMTKLTDWNPTIATSATSSSFCSSSGSTIMRRLCSCHKVIEDCGLLTGDYEARARALQQHYYPLEIDPSLSMSDKVKYMQEWVVKAHHLLVEYGLTRSIIRGAVSKAVEEGSIQLRAGVPAFFDMAKNLDVPVLIFSAGLYDVIERVLSEDAAFSPLILSKDLVEGREFDIISNRCLFEESGAGEKVLSLSEPMIHVFNKRCSHHVEHPMIATCNNRNKISYNNSNSSGNSSSNSSSNISSSMKSRVLLIGDSPGDVHMSEGLDCGINIDIDRSSGIGINPSARDNGVIKVGFLNDLVADRLSGFLDIFDLVILGDGTFEPLNKLLAKLNPN